MYFSGNKLLAAMSASDREQIRDQSEVVSLAYRQRLEEAHRPIDYVYFIESGIASILYRGSGDHQAEMALVGSEGCTGCSLILGADSSPQGTTVHIPGQALRITARDLRYAMESSDSLRHILCLFVHTLIIQRDESALSASKATIPQRLARWLLMAADRTHGEDIALTHDLLSIMLGVRRAGVSVAVKSLTDAELIESTRGKLRIRDRAKLRSLAGIYYGAAGAEFDRLIAASNKFESDRPLRRLSTGNGLSD